jgi:hypothetical protein
MLAVVNFTTVGFSAIPATIGMIGAVTAALIGRSNRGTVRRIASKQADMTEHVEDARALAEVAAHKTLKIEEHVAAINDAVNTVPAGNTRMVENVQELTDKAIVDDEKLQQILEILRGAQ